jgi:hypothetical protein
MQKQSLDKLLDSVPEEYIQQYMDSRIKDKWTHRNCTSEIYTSEIVLPKHILPKL